MWPVPALHFPIAGLSRVAGFGLWGACLWSGLVVKEYRSMDGVGNSFGVRSMDGVFSDSK